MRCDASELTFEALLEGTLAPRRRVELEAHLAECRRCTSVLEELRVVDALLLAPRTLEPPANFTFKTMAEIRGLPLPKMQRPRWPWLFALYLALSWGAIAAWFAFGRPDARAMLGLSLDALRHVAGALEGIARVTTTGFGLGYAGIAGIVTMLLVLDIALLGCVLFLLGVVRPRLAAHLARSEAG